MRREQRDGLSHRRQRLLIRSAELRITLATQAQVLKAPLAVVDRARARVQWLRSHPQWPLGALGLLAVLRPRRTLRWATRLWWGWGLYQRAQAWFAREPAQPNTTG